MSSDEFDFRLASGFPRPASCIPFADKGKIVSDLSLHYSVLISLAELEQLQRGLALQTFSSLIETNPTVMRKAFQPPEQITSTFIQDLFVPSLSQKGSNKWEKEEAIVMRWIQYLANIAGVYVCTCVYMCLMFVLFLQRKSNI